MAVASAAPPLLRRGRAAASEIRPRCRCADIADTCWPNASEWELLNATVGNRLLVPELPIQPCLATYDSDECRSALNKTRSSPYSNMHSAGGYQSAGWNRAWLATNSTYAVAAENVTDVQAAVRFAMHHNLRLVVKGAGHDYLGRSTATQGASLLVWTLGMNDIEFAPDNSSVTIGPGVIWDKLYVAAQERGRFVIGGGCASVGAAGGFPQGGGFGIFSKRYGSAADNIVAATVVTASGEVLIANETINSDLFWALRGGGGGTFGVVTSLTYRTWPAPKNAGFVGGKIECPNAVALSKSLEQVMGMFTPGRLLSDTWGFDFHGLGIDRSSITLGGFYIGIDSAKAKEAFVGVAELPNSTGCRWGPLPDGYAQDAAREYPNEVTYLGGLLFLDFPKLTMPDGSKFAKIYPLPFDVHWTEGHWFNGDKLGESNAFWAGYISRYIPLAEFENPKALASKLALMAAAGGISLKTNKGLAGGSGTWAAQNTSYNPNARQAGALLTVGGISELFPQLLDVEAYQKAELPAPWRRDNPAVASACDATQRIQGGNYTCKYAVEQMLDGQSAAIEAIGSMFRTAFSEKSGSYTNEADFFEPDWQSSLWGSNYQGLRKVKAAVDPMGLFVCHHCVGSEDWSADGNCKIHS